MKAPDFAYARPETVAEAIALLSDPARDARVLAGGQSLMPMMNFRLAAPELLVDINRLPGLSGVERTAAGLRIGALTRYADLMAEPLVAETVPMLAAALPWIAHPAIRNRGTIGGSLALADPAAEAPAVARALGATLHLEGPNGARRVAADDFFQGLYETAKQDDELLTAVEFPAASPQHRFVIDELARRHGDYAMVGLAVGTWGAPDIHTARVVYFAVSDRPVRLEGAEAALTGARLGDASAAERALAAVDCLDCDGDLQASPEMKRHLARVLLKRALTRLEGADR